MILCSLFFSSLFRVCNDIASFYKCLNTLIDTESTNFSTILFVIFFSGLSAKVFRTYNASETLQNELPTPEDLAGLSIQEKVLRYNAANREVAILCNHQKTVSKAAETMFESLNEKLETLKSQSRELLDWKTLIEKKKSDKIPLKDDDKDQIDAASDKLKSATLLKEAAKSNDEKIRATQVLSHFKTMRHMLTPLQTLHS